MPVSVKLVAGLLVYEVQLEFLLLHPGFLRKDEDGNTYTSEGRGSRVYV